MPVPCGASVLTAFGFKVYSGDIFICTSHYESSIVTADWMLGYGAFIATLSFDVGVTRAHFERALRPRLTEVAVVTTKSVECLTLGLHLIVSLVALLSSTLADVVVITATWTQTFEIIRLQGTKQLWSRRSLASLLLRDGTPFFVQPL